ncbi:hypothetical protein FLM48_05675 [Shewanella sp. Scap07]|nr:hypothetical protein [Shewanella sp. Scap07]QLE87726.1 hypothetical protein FLM48_05675 [Shewanella sp. Scap07]
MLMMMLSACSSVEEQQFYHRINDAYDFEVTHCDSFAMSSGVGRGEHALQEAQDNARRYGEEIGGTHIVWLQTDEIDDSVKVIAVVYKCLQ